jgi:hypothetical protein
VKLTVRMHLDGGRDRMTAEQAVRVARLTETFSDGRLTVDEEGKLYAILDAIEQLAAAVNRARRERPLLRAT